MERSNGSGTSEPTKPTNHQLEKKRLNRAPSPARPFLKDVRSSTKPAAIVPKSPKLTKQQHSSSPVALSSNQSRISRRTATGAKDNKPAAVKSHSTKSSTVTKKTVKVIQHAALEPKPITASSSKPPPDSSSSPHLALKAKKSKIAALTASHRGPLSLGSPIRVPTGATPHGSRVSQTDSSSDLSDCPSEPLSDEQRLAAAESSDGESGGSGSGASNRNQVDYPLQSTASVPDAAGAVGATAGSVAGSFRTAEGSPAAAGKGGMSQAPGEGAHGHGGEGSEQEKASTSAPFIKLECSKEIIEEDLLREIEDLRSENEYLKDEVEELRAEMEEARDSYLEEEVHQVQELRRELDRSNKNCRILQYRLRKAEQKSLRVAQTGHVDGDLLRNLEQDIKVAKDVSVRLHNELESVEDKRTRAEDENELLRQRIIEVEISKQALHNELDRTKETALRRRGSRETFKDKKYVNQEDSADLRCQLQFSKEESTLMRKKMAKLGREKEELEQEIQKYKSVYGDVDSPLPLAELAGGGPHSTREAELRLRLKLVEEEANILGRKIVELEVENRGLRAENEDIRCQYERDCFGREPFGSMPSSPYGGDALESAGELRRHLQFVEEEAELLRRSISEIEDHNKQLTSELNRFKFGPRDEEVEVGVMLMKTGNGSNGGSGGNGSGVVMMEELKAARMQINELSGKVMKLQYENRVLMSNVQRCDLAQHLGFRTGSPRDSDADSDTGRRDTAEEEETGRLLLLHPKREGPVGGESDSEDLFEKTTTTSGFGSHKPSDATELANLRREEREMFMNVKREAERLGKTVDRLITDTDSLIYEGKIVVTGGDSLCIEGFRGHRGEGSGEDRGDTTILPESLQDSQVLDTINTRMKAFRTELHIFMDKVDHLGDGLRERGRGPGSGGRPVAHAQPYRVQQLPVRGHLHVPRLAHQHPGTRPGYRLPDVSANHVVHPHSSPLLVSLSQSGARDELEWRLGQERDVETQGQSHDQGGLPQGPAQNRGAILGHTRYHRAPLASLRPELRDTAEPEMQFRLDQDRRLRPGQEDREAFSGTIAQDEERRRLEAQGVRPRGGLDLTGLQAHEAPWVQERTLLQQEVRLFRHNTIVFYMKLRWILMHWRLGRRPETGEEAAHSEYEKLEGIPELEVILEYGEGETEREDRGRSCTQLPQRDSPDPGPTTQLPSPDRLQPQRQVGENRRVLHALRSLLEEFREELREEESRRCQLQQNYANDKASWEVKWAEMKCHVAQLEEEKREERGEERGEVRGEERGEERGELRGEAQGGGGEPYWAFKQEREEHRCLLAESHSTSLDLHWKLQHGEKRWGRERRDLLERFDQERQEWDSNMRNMHHKMERLQRELNVRQGREGSPSDVKDGATAGGRRGVFSPQESPCKAPRSPRSPRSSRSAIPGPVSLPTRSHSDSEAHEEQGAVVRVRGPPENLFLDALTLDPLGSLEVPPPSRLDSDKRFPCMNEALNEIPDREDPMYQEEEGFGSLLSATLTTNTLSSPEPPPHCQHSPLRGNGGNRGGGASVHVSHSPTRPPGTPEQDYLYPKGTKGRGGGSEVGDPPGLGGVGVPDEVFGDGRWPPTCHKEILEGGGGLGGGLRGSPGGGPIPTVGYASSLELSQNLSDDMKEVAFSVRNYRSGPSTSDLLEQHRQLRDTACQTNGFTTRGTQTTLTISVGLQTDLLRTLTSSPHRCLTPTGGGSTPISSPSRNIRKMQYSPVVQSKFERTCCSPKYGSPKLQRKPSTSSKADLPVGASSSFAAGPRAPTPTTPQKGASESAWARSTTTRDSPVHTTINDGLSSLFNIIDHTPVAYEPLQSKFTKSPSRTRPAPPDPSPPGGSGVPSLTPSDPKDPRSLGAAQEFLRNVRGRSPSPVQLIVEAQGGPGGTGGERTPEVLSIRQDLSAPPGYNLAENAARLLNKKLLEQSFREEKRLGSAGQSREGKQGEGDRNQAGCMEIKEH
ncbi:hypothetical protein J4Q44_G00192830 [Coregonus suidteri]|uniref:DUF4482 domain-containing protein n=1 Tax=Coregonus suidteri TaxID=861788 RepID=A0AAN8LI55_9TELE